MIAKDSRVGQMFGHYQIVGLIGRGGMGEVYRAEDTKKGRTVALKILAEQYSQDEKFRTRFQRESHAAAILQEPHVIPIHDWGEIDGNLYIDMRLVQGQTLHQLLAGGPIDPARATLIVGGVAAALDAAHAAGLIHRDVKPQNIIVTSTDFPYLVDFGIASTVGETGLTMTGAHIGTFDYMAPERFGDRDATPAVDVYALACVLYECLTGDTPYPTNSLEQTMAAHLTAAPPRPSAVNPRVPSAFDDVIARGMAKEPADRYDSATALGRAAQRALGSDAGAGALVTPTANTVQAAVPYTGPFPHPRAESPTDHLQSHPSYPPIPAQPPPPSRRWVLPTVVAVTAALLLGAVGIVIGLVADDGSDESGQSGMTRAGSGTRQTVYRTVPGTPDEPTPPTTTEPLGSGAPPPLVRGLDTYGQSCDAGFTLSGRTDFGAHAGRGSESTSCRFTDSVLRAYWSRYGNPSRDVRMVSAPGTVDCRSVPSPSNGCSGSDFVMRCAGQPGQAYLTCEGGNGARVFLY